MTSAQPALARPIGRTVPLCFLAALAEGFDIQSMGVAAPGLAPALALTRDQMGPVFSASILGLLVGAVLFGRAADFVGRKWILILSLAMFGLFSAATAFAWSLTSLLTVRVLAGLGLGGAMPNIVALTAEAAEGRPRARLVTLVTSGMPFGGALAGAVAAALPWRGIFYVGGAAPIILALSLTLALPESRAFLKARRIGLTPEAPRTDFRSILFGSGRALTTLLLWTAVFAALLTLYLLLNWLPTLMGAKGVSRSNASLVSLLFNLGGGLGVLILAALLDRRGRAWVLTLWYVGLTASLIALAGVGVGLAAAGTAGFAAGLFVASAPMVFYALAPGYYPVVMRGAGVGAMVAAGRLGAIVGPLLAAALLGAGAGPSGVLLALLPLVAIAGAATLALLGRPSVVD